MLEFVGLQALEYSAKVWYDFVEYLFHTSYLDNGTSFYEIRINNTHSSNAQLTWKGYAKMNGRIQMVDTLSGVTNILANDQNFHWFQYFVRDPEYIVLNAFDVFTKKQLYVNNKITYNITEARKPLRNKIVIGSYLKESKYFVKLAVTNLLPKLTVIYWILNGQKKWRFIRPYYFNYVIMESVKSYEKPPPVIFKSYIVASRKRVLTNDLPFFKVSPVLLESLKHNFVFISEKNTEKSVTFYFSNPTRDEVIVTWRTVSLVGNFSVPKHRQSHPVTITISGGFRSQQVRFEPKSTGSEYFLINGNKRLYVRVPYRKIIHLDYPYRTLKFKNTLQRYINLISSVEKYSTYVFSNSTKFIKILEKDINRKTITFTAVDERNDKRFPINEKSSVTFNKNNFPAMLQIGGAFNREKNYFVKLWVNNNHSHNVILEWEEKGIKYTKPIPVNFDEEILLTFASEQPISIKAKEMYPQKYLYINLKDELTVRPSKIFEYAKSVVIDNEINIYDYFYQLLVNNYGISNIVIELRKGNLTLKADVPKQTRNFTINTPLVNIREGPKQAMKVYAYHAKSKESYYINKKEFIRIFPTLNEDEFVTVNTGIRKLPLFSFQYSLSITVLPPTKNVLLKYLFKSEARVSRIPYFARNYRLVLPLKFHRIPKNITIKAYAEDTGKQLLINDAWFETLIPFSNSYAVQNMNISTSRFQEVKGRILEKTMEFLINKPLNKTIILKWGPLKEDQNHSLLIPIKVEKQVLPISIKNQSNMKLVFSAYIDSKQLKINNFDYFVTHDFARHELITLNITAHSETDSKEDVKRKGFEDKIYIPLITIKAKLINIEETVRIVWTFENGSKSFNQLPLGKVHHMFNIASLKSLKLTAAARKDNKPYLLNGTYWIIVLPNKTNYIEITASPVIYYYSLMFTNKVNGVVLLTFKGKSIRIMPNEKNAKYFFNVLSTDYPEDTYLSGIFENSRIPAILNGKTSLLITPTLIDDSFTVIEIKEESQSISFYIDNLLDEDVVLKWSFENKTQSKLLAANSMKTLLSVKETTSVIFTSVNTNGKPLTINSSSSIRINRGQPFPVLFRIGEETYYYHIIFENKELFDVSIHWNIKGKPSKEAIKGLTVKDLLLESDNNNKIAFTATEVWKNKPLLINNKTLLEVVGANDKTSQTYASVSAYPSNTEKQQLIALDVSNLLLSNVTLQWKENQHEEIKPRASSYELVLSFPVTDQTSNLITFTAVGSSGEEVLLNMRSSVSMRPSQEKFPRPLILSAKGTS